ncbi:unnamed protein product, partial [Hymenolepis diminuta]
HLSLSFLLVRFGSLKQNSAFVFGFKGRSPFIVHLVAFIFDTGFDSITVGITCLGCCFFFFFLLIFVMRSWGFFCGLQFRFISFFELTIGSVT